MTKSYIVSLPPTTILEFFPAIVGTVVSKCAFFLILTNMVFDVKEALHEPITRNNLREGFWPTTHVEANVADQIAEDGEECEEFGEDDPYVGPLNGRPQPSFRIGRNVQEGYFVAIQYADGETQPVWIARALPNPDCNPEKPNCILIQYFRPTSRSVDIQ